MANELTIQGRIRYNPSSDRIVGIDSGLKDILVTMQENDYVAGTQVATNTEAALKANSDISTLGYVLIINTDSEEAVVIGHADVAAADDARPIKIKAGEIALFRANGDIYIKTVNASAEARIEFYAFEN